ncbi:MAG: hypothetical protein Kow0098_16060 [Ignavibacteriaceae bacterium]
MKKLVLFFAGLILFAAAAAAKPPEKNRLVLPEDTYNRAVDNLLKGLASDNLGLKVSSAYLLGEFESDKAVIPLLKVLHSEKNVEARVIAALSLYKIGDSRGIYAIKQAIRYDTSKRVNSLCEKFYFAYLSKENRQEEIVAIK